MASRGRIEACTVDLRQDLMSEGDDFQIAYGAATGPQSEFSSCSQRRNRNYGCLDQVAQMLAFGTTAP